MIWRGQSGRGDGEEGDIDVGRVFFPFLMLAHILCFWVCLFVCFLLRFVAFCGFGMRVLSCPFVLGWLDGWLDGWDDKG
jgi:hypothetical protein